jgi:hypothetical protein
MPKAKQDDREGSKRTVETARLYAEMAGHDFDKGAKEIARGKSAPAKKASAKRKG